MAPIATQYDLQSLIPVWLTLHIAGGQIGLPIIVLTFIFGPKSAGRQRYVTLINFCITWIIYSVVYCILLYSGQAGTNQDGPSSLCLAQAALIHGAPPMCAVAGLEMVLQLWFVQRCIHRSSFPYIWKLPSPLLNFLIILPPYVAFMGFSLLALGHGIHEEDLILSVNHVYCSTQNYRFSLIVPIFCAIVMAAIIVVEAIIWYNWYKTRKEVDDLLAKNQTDELIGIAGEYQHRRLSISISIRVGLFSLYSIATLSACIVFVSNMPSSFPYMVEACLPMAAFLLFGTQRDTLELWFCRRRRSNSRSLSDIEKGIPSARRQPTRSSVLSELAPSVLTTETDIVSDLTHDLKTPDSEFHPRTPTKIGI
ncbi:uncharacterized protein FOMMEDRAFT_161520 [Fomitiporia mediterranea MF3/22]|uniref:uncharacterized protein n=1 Tax=Fomitiporia mediterranea (strain MF3/22) TaxID=694068 RepID=UPI0004407C02|nr:uncharacterized protein FOMMEDRAFT_161520 [Fomitiporia mediterranea MF3/22]EJC98688.1 hypothetical protein FOMMEDRAFT_161520 [Fomitiporia mediterranea MF3/22]